MSEHFAKCDIIICIRTHIDCRCVSVSKTISFNRNRFVINIRLSFYLTSELKTGTQFDKCWIAMNYGCWYAMIAKMGNRDRFFCFIQYLHSYCFIISLVEAEQRNSFSIDCLFLFFFFQFSRKLRNYQKQKLHLLLVKKIVVLLFLFVPLSVACNNDLFSTTRTHFFFLWLNVFFSLTFSFSSRRRARVSVLCGEYLQRDYATLQSIRVLKAKQPFFLSISLARSVSRLLLNWVVVFACQWPWHFVHDDKVGLSLVV